MGLLDLRGNFRHDQVLKTIGHVCICFIRYNYYLQIDPVAGSSELRKDYTIASSCWAPRTSFTGTKILLFLNDAKHVLKYDTWLPTFPCLIVHCL